MNSLHNIMDTLLQLGNAWAGPSSRLWPFYLLTMIGIFVLLYCRSQTVSSFFQWAFPAKIYFHKSHFVDIKLFFVSRLLALLGVDPERENPGHLEPEDFGRKSPPMIDESPALRAAGDDLQLRAAVQHLRVLATVGAKK